MRRAWPSVHFSHAASLVFVLAILKSPSPPSTAFTTLIKSPNAPFYKLQLTRGERMSI